MSAAPLPGGRCSSKAGFPSEFVHGNTDHAALRPVTCGGPFDGRSGHHLDNIVVLASLVGADQPQPAQHRGIPPAMR